MIRRIALLVAALVLVPAPAHAQRAGAAASAPARTGLTTREFARTVEDLSEPGGQFDTDNLISNERGFLHVMGALDRIGVRGGAYIGVGPDQNFSYIARIRPTIAFVVDIRRDNLLQQLLFKALFARARNRVEYLALLTGRPLPPRAERWASLPADSIVAWVDGAAPTEASMRAARAAVGAEVRRAGLDLSAADHATIERFHGAFIEAGLDLKFTSTGRAPRWFYPTLRDLVRERDLEGRQASYLARETDFQFLKELQRRNLVVPVVGDLAGPHALGAIGRLVRQRNERVSVFYTSNVEDYLMRGGSFEQFARTTSALPRDARSVIIRSYFGRGPLPAHPEAVPGYQSTQLLQLLDTFAADVADGGYRSYSDLVMRNPLKLR
jgi:hypothetical protein